MRHDLTFRFAAAKDFEAVLHLACQLAKQIEVEAPPLTSEQFERYYLSQHAPMRLLLAVHSDRVVGMISWTLTHELTARTLAFTSAMCQLTIPLGVRV
jgi:hypothetical protein